MELQYYHKRDLKDFILELFVIRMPYSVPHVCCNTLTNYIDSLLVLIHGKNRIGIGEATFTDEKKLEEAKFIAKNFIDEISIDDIYNRKLLIDEDRKRVVAINTCLESFREDLIFGKKLNKIAFEFPHYINSNDCLLKIYEYKPKIIKLNVGGNYLKDIEIIKKIEQILTVFKIHCKLRIFGNELYHTFEVGQLLTQINPKLVESVIQLMPQYLNFSHLDFKENFPQYKFGLKNIDTDKINSEKWLCKIDLDTCGSISCLNKIIKKVKYDIVLGNDLGGYITSVYELMIFSKNYNRINPIVETRGFTFLTEEFSGIHKDGACSYTIDLDSLIRSFLKNLNFFRRK